MHLLERAPLRLRRKRRGGPVSSWPCPEHSIISLPVAGKLLCQVLITSRAEGTLGSNKLAISAVCSLVNLRSADAMVKYSCYFINNADRFESMKPIDAASDRDALSLAKQLLRSERGVKAVEVWNQSKLIGRVDQERT